MMRKLSRRKLSPCEFFASKLQEGLAVPDPVGEDAMQTHTDSCQSRRMTLGDEAARFSVSPKTVLWMLLFATFFPSLGSADVPSSRRAAIDRIIGAKGTYIAEEDVYKIKLPKEGATIVQDYQTLSPNFGLNCWAAFTPAVYHQALLTGQLLLLDDEVNPVMSVALKSSLEITGLADSSVFNGLRLKNS